MQVAVTDFTFPDLDLERAVLEPLGCQFVTGQCKSPSELIPLVRDADYVITQFAPVKAEVIAAMQKAKIIVRYGIGVDNVDLAAARERQIPVCNVPDYCIDEVADHTLAFILGATRQVVPHSVHLRNGNWGLATSVDDFRTLRDQTVGVVGFGRIGREVARRLAAFGGRILVFDPVVAAEAIQAQGCQPATLPQLLAESDIVTLHCPSTAETRRLINASSIEQMKRSAWLINLARGDLVDSKALVEALEQNRLAGAALDVFDPEPIPADSLLRKLPNVILAPHIASVSPKAVRKLRETVASLVARRVKGKPLVNIVNGVQA